ncbi:MAG: saccharopine dehydrogenase-like oxidoreductase [Armatimonadota bacterium]
MPQRTVNVAILGAGGLGRSMVELMAHKPHLRLVGICESAGVAIREEGLSLPDVLAAAAQGSVASMPGVGRPSEDSIGDVIAAGDLLDAVFVALPNLPNSFVPDVAARFAAGGFRGVMVDALKRTTAVELMLERHERLQEAGVTYVTGAGATPGLLTAAAALAAQSFVDVTNVDIHFGVGIANWDAYRATIREDIAHLPGFDVARAQAMTEDEIAAELDGRDGILELVDMEHADDVMLEQAGICGRDDVTVGGIVDTRRPKKPVSTTVTIRGRTFDGKESQHTFILGDDTSMAANVCGPALGYMNAGLWLHDRGIHGVFTAADLMPRMEPPAPMTDDHLSVTSEETAEPARAL